MDLREIDRLVAEKVMEWKPERQDHGEVRWVAQDGGYTGYYLEAHRWNLKAGDARYFEPTEDIAAAWLVVEKLLPDFLLDITWWQIDAPNIRFFYRKSSAENYGATAATIPLAICLAALKAKGIEVPA